MKKFKIFLFSSFVLVVTSLQSQNTFPTTGNVGIGTTSPITNLHITSPTGVPGFLVERNPGSFFQAAAGAGAAVFFFRENHRFSISPASSTSDFTSDFDNALMIWGSKHSTYPGQMAFGTATPGDNSKFTVAGRIRSEEVQVVNDIEAPDYVFASDYQLRTLDEVEAFIIKNKHLPEIPSAADFCENGVMLGEMSFDLLKKVEELTLYIIDLNKKIESLESQLKK